MTSFKHAARVLGIGLAVAVIATGCASAKRAGQAATPAAAPAAAAEAAPMAKMGEMYKVVRGDCLWCISEQSNIYGNPYKWPLILKANKSQIKDADLIYPGQELTIDRDASAAAIDASIQHAKTRGAWSVGPIESTDTAYLAGSR
jgi:nucleoid-associated protein YgaU